MERSQVMWVIALKNLTNFKNPKTKKFLQLLELLNLPDSLNSDFKL